MLLAVLIAAPALAHSPSPIAVSSAWARRAAGGHGQGQAANGAVYMTIANQGAQADAVVSATSEVAKVVELHESKNEGGVMTMRPLSRFPLPAGGKVEMKPGGYHVMLLGLTRDLHPGDTVKVTLTFEKAAPVTVEAPVR
jgi:hypothetical protein